METIRSSFVNSVRENSGWTIFLGCISILLGLIALSAVGMSTIFSVVYLGVLILLNGIAHIVFGISTRKSGNLWHHLAIGALSVVVGYIVFTRPMENAFVITLFLASYMLITGLILFIGSVVEQFESWGWFAASGVLSVVFSILIFRDPLLSSAWLIGALVGIDLIFRGVTLVQMGWRVRNLAGYRKLHDATA